MSIKLIVGLANPGSQYAKTRHNAGAWFIERLAEAYRITFTTEPKFKALLARATLFDQDVRLCIPLTYMNLSGQSVAAIAQFYKIEPQEILVAHDELDIPTGSARLKLDGGHGGHNGLKDIVERLGTKQFYRLRIGIGRPEHKEDVVDYVLRQPSKSDRDNIDLAIDNALRAMPDVFKGQLEKAMTFLHTEEKR